MASKNMLIVHGGGPTAVLNASLYGAVLGARDNPAVDKIYGALGGTEAVFTGNFIDLKTLPEEKLRLLPGTPGTAIGSSRFHLEPEDYEKMPALFREHNIGYVLLTGGNGSMDTCGKIAAACKGADIRVGGIPKTMDNDLAVTDHAPGYASAARYAAATVQEVGADVRSLPIHIVIVEVMGRNAGWVAASTALARKAPGDAPHLIYTPEVPFDEEAFLSDAKRLFEEKGGVVVVVSEGLVDKEGNNVVPPLFTVGRSVYYDDVSTYLRDLIVKRLGVKVRSEKPGLCGRASIAWQSPVDRDEAILAGKTAAEAIIAGENNFMVGFKRLPGEEYRVETMLVPVEQVMLDEKKMPRSYLNEAGNDVTDEFIRWAKPLVGELPDFVHFN
ncbi:MAG: diphosphate--fructose-6-phosphate 1-phosphotransferase [Oscillospiraceae bacterium]|jgi:6-phosphofructokinase|nr:diphosphate--fructose-6-phosphate 1-phosphotransferase [Oscillospiraceae bacterium]